MLAIKYLFVLLLAIFILAFTLKNMQSVELTYFTLNSEVPYINFDKKIDVPFIVVVICASMFGFFSAWLLGVIENFKLKSSIRSYKKKIQELSEIQKSSGTEIELTDIPHIKTKEEVRVDNEIPDLTDLNSARED